MDLQDLPQEDRQILHPQKHALLIGPPWEQELIGLQHFAEVYACHTHLQRGLTARAVSTSEDEQC